ncbi:1,4-alpha-glucan branching protein GlgB [Solwaraspora sp. WMMA2065]|uniref:1,4-alpha-glucan branching protein GlgB n=1 Tax=Solwaraspora sp. WMMA2065 TaxID=3015166 RepID=UPI00259BC46A|nr:1,4-alpha-glucan branching protein GlgB [Solwaraspora sp. WMMA2065]WJK35933.1 1,4-alpha-glucan branching protein GlgB [Solwaraspora sp. WMMA2065]
MTATREAALTETIGDIDLHLFAEGRHEQLWRMLGAHPQPGGCRFAVWAPNARRVRVIGDGPGWGPYDGQELDRLESGGVWAGFVPGVVAGQRYKYRVQGCDGSWADRADPMAQATEVPPRTASVVYQSGYVWQDADWLRNRRGDHHARPMSVYEVHLGSWRPGLSYRELADQLVSYVSDLGFTHVELMPVMEHPFGGSWGYQVTGYYAPTSRFGTPDDFRHLVDRLHGAGIGVLLDWVPAHFPRDAWALARFDGTALYEHPDPRRGEHPDWGSLIFDYGRREVRNFLVANALYWLEEFHVDGLRVDAVASMLYLDYSRGPGQWLPNDSGGNAHTEAIELLKELNATAYRLNPGVVMIAEESTAWPGVTRPTDWGGLGFGLKWNMGWMHDTLSYLARDPVHRSHHHDEMTWPAAYAHTEQFLLPISHDEVVHGKGSLTAKLPGDRWQRLAGLRGLLAYMWAFPGKQLLFMGSELADEQEWSEQRGLDWSLAADPAAGGVLNLLRDLNAVYRQCPALWELDVTPGGFGWIDHTDRQANVVSFLRRARDGSVLACVVNFSGVPRHGYRIGLPQPGRWQETINTDAEWYGGSNVGNLGAVVADGAPLHGQPVSAGLQVGPFATVWLRPDPVARTDGGGGRPATETAETRAG